MPARSLRWRSLVPGLVALAAVGGGAFAILKYGRIGALRGDTYHLYMYSNEARGVLENSDVWLAGQRVGSVQAIDFRPIVSDTAKRLRLTLEILEKYQPLIRHDSYAQIRSGGRLLGEPVVYVTIGTDSAPLLQDRAILPSREQADPENLTSELALASRLFPEIIDNAKRIKEQLDALALQMDAEGVDEPGVALRVLSRKAERLGQPGALTKGTLGRALDERGAMLARVARLRMRTDSLLARLRSPSGTTGAAMSDSLLRREIQDVRNEASIVRALLERSSGTAGRALHDRAIIDGVAALERELGLLLADFSHNPARYIVQ